MNDVVASKKDNSIPGRVGCAKMQDVNTLAIEKHLHLIIESQNREAGKRVRRLYVYAIAIIERTLSLHHAARIDLRDKLAAFPAQ
jgi:hypothetical protein